MFSMKMFCTPKATKGLSSLNHTPPSFLISVPKGFLKSQKDVYDPQRFQWHVISDESKAEKGAGQPETHLQAGEWHTPVIPSFGS